MKIDLECTICRSVLRVDAEHAGKQLRCPNCGGITSIPFQTDPSLADETGSESTPPTGDAIPTAPYRPDQNRPQYRHPIPPHSPGVEVTGDAPRHAPPPPAPTGYRRQGDHYAGRQKRWDEDQYAHPYPHYAGHHQHQSLESGGTSIFLAILGFLALPSCYCPAPILFAIGLSKAAGASGTTAYVGNILNTLGLVIWGLTLVLMFIM